jgi:hypothetical protein
MHQQTRGANDQVLSSGTPATGVSRRSWPSVRGSMVNVSP